MEIEGVLTQILGFIVFGMGVYATSQKHDSHFKKFITIQAFLLSLNFLLLGAMTGFAVAFVVGCRNFLAFKMDTKALAPAFVGLFIAIGYLNFEAVIDLFPVASSISATLALSYLSGAKLRMVFMGCSSLWAVHNLAYGAYGPALMEMMMVVMGAITVYRLLQAKPSIAAQAAE